MSLPPFQMERWQSRFEHRVSFNLSESGVEPLTFAELVDATGLDPADLSLGYVQTNGTDLLRERIADLYPGAGPENVVVTSGGAEANYLVLWTLLAPGDGVAILEPTYGQTPGLAAGLGARVTRFFLEEARAWQPAPGAASAAVNHGDRLVVVTNPNNPTGAILGPEATDEILAAASDAGAWLLSDEVYVGAEVDGRETQSFWGRYGRSIVTSSLSKAYGLPGLRLGWVVAPEKLVEEIWARKDYTTIAVTALSDAFAARVLEPEVRAGILARTRQIIRENLASLSSWLDARSDTFDYVAPEAGAICYVRYGLEANSTALAERLRTEKSVLVVPGDHFGMDRYLRIGFGSRNAELCTALDRISQLLES